MDLTRLAVDAGQFINRAVQFTEESLGQAERTELQPGLEELLSRADATKTWTDTIVSQTEVLLQPNPGARLEDRLYEHLDWHVPPRPRAHEALGDQMTQAGLEIGSNTPYGMALLRCGEAQKQLGITEKNFIQSTNIHFLTPLRSFTEGEYRAIQDERRMLVNKRLDLDIATSRLKKAHEADREARNLNGNPVEEDYLSHVSYMFSFLRVKWLKIWAQEISQAEMELRICQSLFDRQTEITRRVVEGLSNTHANHMRSLTDFVEAQACYYDQCHQHAQELQKQLASIPAVLCSNNWQSAISNEVNQPSTSNHVANEPVGLNQVTPIPVVVHQLPEFDQDSWTVNPLPGTERTTDPSVTMQPHNQTNNNNNNNTSLSDGPAVSRSAEAGRAFGHVSASHSDPTDPMSAVSQTANVAAAAITNAAAPPPSERSGTSNQSHIASETITTNNMAAETITTNNMAAETITTNTMAAETSVTNTMAAETITTNTMAAETITTNTMAAETITTNNMAAETITTNTMAAETSVTNTMAAETITTNTMAAETSVTNTMAAETITTNNMAAETITTNNMAAETSVTNNMAAETITTNNMAAETITTNNMAAETSVTNNMAAETITTNNMAAETITTNNMAAETITTNTMAAETSVTNTMAAETSVTNTMAAETSVTNTMAAETSVTNTMAAETSVTNNMAAETITTNTMAAETITTNNMAAEPQTANGSTSSLPPIKGEDVQESSTESQAAAQ